MDVRDSILDCVGRTPLVALDRFAPPEGDRARVLAKMELMNPYSVKDRPALWMLRGPRRGATSPRAAPPSSRPPRATPASAWPWWPP